MELKQESHTNLQNLLTAVKRVADHQAEIKRLKGENFNLFSILGMETAENKTHSAFLGELLNPKGSHGMGSLFLRLFLEEIGCQAHLDLTTAVSVTLEYHIDWTDYDKETGGRIDIYIEDGNRRSVSIENKIYAGDQHLQLVRYANHNKGKNQVYYLTLDGSDASDASKGNLNKENKDYHCISYRETIIDWLGKCMKEAVAFPILRESIKQYIILLQKLTGLLSDTNMENEIHDLITKNYREARLIEQNVNVVLEKMARLFLEEVSQKIESVLPASDGWKTSIDANLWENYSGINLGNSNWQEIAIGLKGYTKIVGGNSFYGIFAPKNVWDRAIIVERLSPLNELLAGFRSDSWWPYFQYYELFTGEENLNRLCQKVDWDVWVSRVAAMLVGLAKACEKPLVGIPKVNS